MIIKSPIDFCQGRAMVTDWDGGSGHGNWLIRVAKGLIWLSKKGLY